MDAKKISALFAAIADILNSDAVESVPAIVEALTPEPTKAPEPVEEVQTPEPVEPLQVVETVQTPEPIETPKTRQRLPKDLKEKGYFVESDEGEQTLYHAAKERQPGQRMFSWIVKLPTPVHGFDSVREAIFFNEQEWAAKGVTYVRGRSPRLYFTDFMINKYGVKDSLYGKPKEGFDIPSLLAAIEGAKDSAAVGRAFNPLVPAATTPVVSAIKDRLRDTWTGQNRSKVGKDYIVEVAGFAVTYNPEASPTSVLVFNRYYNTTETYQLPYKQAEILERLKEVQTLEQLSDFIEVVSV